jgi:peptidyl-prolyl cis-trans isomerase B (cyclophilin B)
MVSKPRIRPVASVLLAVAAMTAVIAVIGCAARPEALKTPDAVSGVADATSESSPVAPPVDQPSGLHVSSVKVKGDEIAVVKTPKGTITFKFFAKDAPNTVASFVELADKKFYDGTKWHRVVPGFVIQGGDPLSRTNDPGVGGGGPGWDQKAEFNANKHLEGTVAMARAQDPDSAGSQFYICLAPQPSLDGQYTVFGQVVSGLDVVHKIAQGDAIESVTIQRGQ